MMRWEGGFDLKQYFQTLILYLFIISVFYCTVIVIYPVTFSYKYIFIILWFYLLVALKAYITRATSENTFMTRFPVIFLVLCISFFSIILALAILVIISDAHSIFFDFEEIIKLFTKDNVEIIANSTFLSIITMFFLAYNIYKIIYNKAYLKLAQRMKIDINYQDILPYFTVLVTFFGFLPLFILKFIDSDEVLDKIENYVLILFMISLAPYIHLIFAKAKN